MIPKDTVDAILQATVIEEVVGDFVQLKKSGTSLRGMSPFTNEKTPSFYVVPGKGIFKDFSSGKGGSAVSFLMEHEKLSYPEALRWLARKYGIEIEERQMTPEELEEQTERESLANLSAWAQKWFTTQLLETGEGKSVGLAYFRSRDFSDATLSDFALGYCPDRPWGEEGALVVAARKAGYKDKWLTASGLCKEREDGTLYDFYRGRVIFPIRDVTGRFIGFGGRTLKTDKKVPKYVNSPESPLYDKSRALYGIYLARNAIVREDRAILVEGYTDVMAMRQAGVEHVVASSGTALTVEQVRLLRRFSKRMTMLFDGDPAGLRAAIRGVDIVLGEGLDVKVAVLPDGEDPDTFAKRMGREALMEWLAEHSRDFIRFKIDLLDAEAADDPIKRTELVRSVVQSIAHVPDELKRTVYIQESAGRLGMQVEDLLAELSRQARARLEKEAKAPLPSLQPEREAPIGKPRLLGKVGRPGREQDLLRLLLQYGPQKITLDLPEDVVTQEDGEENPSIEAPLAEVLMHELDTMGIAIRHPIVDEVIQMYRAHMKEGRIPGPEIWAQSGPEVAAMTADILVTEFTLSDNWENRHGIIPETEAELLLPALQGALYRLLLDEARRDGQRITSRLGELAEDPGTSEDPMAEEVDLLKRKITVSKRIERLAAHFGSTILHRMGSDEGL
ncbi:MAG: DNA primase [Flavobacteriales bacterium]|nr:DNA primase [Flavobacteriales bacterium]